MSNRSLNSIGFYVVENLFNVHEVESIKSEVRSYSGNELDLNQDALLSIRSPLVHIPTLRKHLFNENLKQLVNSIGSNYKIVKSIYFDKPPLSNWFVPNHQDLTINVKVKSERDGFSNWVKKEGCYSVQPPTYFLENIVTLRIHLDDTDENNGALIVKPKSHLNGLIRNEKLSLFKEETVKVKAGGVMLMKPLLFHKSLRTTNEKRRRVIHIELCNLRLPKGLEWTEITELV